MLFAPLLLVVGLAAAPPTEVGRGTVCEITLTAAVDHADPLRDVAPRVRFTFAEPLGTLDREQVGKSATVDAFWDGGRTWKARFSPPYVGEWTWEVVGEADAGMVSGTGQFRCVHSADGHRWPRVAEPDGDGASRYLTSGNAVGSRWPLFWLADTAWNGVLKAKPKVWDEYLRRRRGQGFTAIQFVGTQWRGANATLPNKPIVVADGRVVGVDPDMLRAMDGKVAAVTAHGLIPAPVLLWAVGPDDPGNAWSEADAVLVARYLKARWGAYGCVWLLGGDGKYQDVDRWKRIGRAVFPPGESDGSGFDRGPVTLHMAGRTWVADRFVGEEWFDFVGYQSGHGESDDDLKWLTKGPPATWWKTHSIPVLNLEPNYEGHPAYKTGTPHDAFHVRRAAWWSVLNKPTAGVSFGNEAIWPWNDAPGPVDGHGKLLTTGIPKGWASTNGFKTDGTGGMTQLKAFFAPWNWQNLRPAQDLIANQSDDPAAFVVAARTPDGRWTVIYTPVGGTVILTKAGIAGGNDWRLFNPRTGEEAPMAMDELGVLQTPPGHDWVIERRVD
ncbi:DUF4038 domain-containing protein [Alienimonas chondri]|uniref:DUF4038 domain-containing protein n=1 Tax=Alienimonas chondri TaxID=2681879 RepID=A0ABX1VD77_9PLAN|nr:DUF4038 domain-containing protein [Alienimonas chondri]NNJ26067.1 hypothetical protein [Alienimonas chondri]